MADSPDFRKVVVDKPARSAKSGRQGERPDQLLLDRIAHEVFRNPSVKASALYRELEADDRWRPALPYQRAFTGMVARAKERMDTGRWSPVDVDDEEAALVLPVLGRIRASHERQKLDFWFDPRIAGWVARIRRWLPTIEVTDQSADHFHLLAVFYADRSERGARCDDLDDLVAEWGASGRPPTVPDYPMQTLV